MNLLLGTEAWALRTLMFTDSGHEKVNSHNANHSTTESGPQFDMQTLEKIISEKVRKEVENVVATVETMVHEAVLSAIDNLIVPRMELVMIGWNFSGPNPNSVVLDPDEKVFFGDTNGLRMTASSRFNSSANVNGID